MKARQILIALYVKHNGDWLKMYRDIYNKIDMNEKETIKVSTDFETKHKKVITLLDDEYPNDLKARMYPPFVLVQD